jgi:hypothetical protein
MAEPFVKTIADLLNINDEVGLTDDDKMLIQADGGSTYNIKLSELRATIANPGQYSPAAAVFAGSKVAVSGLYDGVTTSETLQTIKEVASPVASFILSAEQTIPDSTWTKATWSSPHTYSGNFANWFDVSSPTRVLFNSATTGSLFLITGVAHFESDGTGTRGIRINQSNASPTIADSLLTTYVDAAANNGTYVVFNYAVPEIDSGRYFELEVYQDSGGDLPLFDGSTQITVWKVK